MSQFGLPCFEENLKLFADPRIDPEKYNLYNGLRSMAAGLETLTQAFYNIELRIHQLETKIDYLSASR